MKFLREIQEYNKDKTWIYIYIYLTTQDMNIWLGNKGYCIF